MHLLIILYPALCCFRLLAASLSHHHHSLQFRIVMCVICCGNTSLRLVNSQGKCYKSKWETSGFIVYFLAVCVLYLYKFEVASSIAASDGPSLDWCMEYLKQRSREAARRTSSEGPALFEEPGRSRSDRAESNSGREHC